jgi:regulation of enolase protein 1 (concanavalin A-like superfamily)
MTLAPDRRAVLTGAFVAAATPLIARAQAAPPTEAWGWLNPPKAWKRTADGLVCRAEPGSDFWRLTAGAGRIDSGHFFSRPVRGDFEVEVTLAADYAADADQTGVMARVDAANWMKTGVEWLGGRPHAASVFTRDWSDGASQPLGEMGPVRVRLSRKGQTLACAYALADGKFVDSRIGYLPMGESVEVGLMCAAPTGKGFEARFSDLRTKAG